MRRVSFVLILVLFIVSVFTGCEHVHEFDPVSLECECGEVSPDAMFQVIVMSDMQSKYGFTNVSDMLAFVGEHQAEMIAPTVMVVRDIACSGISVNDLNISIDTNGHTLTFTNGGCLEISGESSVTVCGQGNMGQSANAEYLFKVNGGLLSVQNGFAGSVYVATDAVIRLSGSATQTITGYTTESETDMNLSVQNPATFFLNPTVAVGVWDKMMSDSTYEPQVLSHSHVYNDYSICGSCGHNKYAYLFEITDGVLNVTNTSKKTLLVGGVTIPNGVVEIEEEAFKECNLITQVAFPASLRKIDHYAFKLCSSLGGTLVLNEGLEELQMYCFYGTGITGIDFPGSIEEYGYGTFGACLGLTSVEIPDGVQETGMYVFYNCTELTSVTLPASYTILENGVFMGCSKLGSIIFKGTTAQWNLVSKSTDQAVGWNVGCPATMQITCLGDSN